MPTRHTNTAAEKLWGGIVSLLTAVLRFYFIECVCRVCRTRYDAMPLLLALPVYSAYRITH